MFPVSAVPSAGSDDVANATPARVACVGRLRFIRSRSTFGQTDPNSMLTLFLPVIAGFAPHYPPEVARSIQRWDLPTLREQVSSITVKRLKRVNFLKNS